MGFKRNLAGTGGRVELDFFIWVRLSSFWKDLKANQIICLQICWISSSTQIRVGVELEFIWNAFKWIRKFAIQLIRKGKKYLKNSMKINLNSIRLILLQLQVGVKLSEIGFVQNSFNRIQKLSIRLIRKVRYHLKNLMKIISKFVRFDSNYSLESNFSDGGFVSKFVGFDSKIYDSIDSKGEK